MKNLILRNLGGGISIIVDIEVVPSVYLLRQLHEASLLWRRIYVFQSSAFLFHKIARGQVIVRYFTGLETVRLSIRVYVLTVPGLCSGA